MNTPKEYFDYERTVVDPYVVTVVDSMTATADGVIIVTCHDYGRSINDLSAEDGEDDDACPCCGR